MLGNLLQWLDQRTGYRALIDSMLLEHVPGGARWRYVWGSCLTFVFSIQVVTGLMLMWSYSPGDTTAWGSVYYIQYEMDFGWFIRGLHHFGSQTMVVLLGLHMLQVVLAGAHLAPREFNWWLGLGLLGAVLGMSLTGYLLPWDQKGYFATQVSTNIMGHVPVAGSTLQTVLVGGSEYGNSTLTHFYALHVGIIPVAIVILLVAHLALFRRHGVTAPANSTGMEYFWPGQVFKDLVACLLVLIVMVCLVVFGGHGNAIENDPHPVAEDAGLYEQWAKAGRKGLGANLDAPADRLTESYPARPEWYFLFLFQLLKYFEGSQELVGTFYIPNGVMLLLFILPLLGYGRMRKFGHYFGVAVVGGLLIGVGILTFLALEDDAEVPMLGRSEEKEKAAKQFHEEIEKAHQQASRVVALAAVGIPQEGARELLRRDPLTQGPKLFSAHCASCHVGTKENPATAPDLTNYGKKTAEWVRGLLKDPGSKHYFGFKGSKQKRMISWRENVDFDRMDWKDADPKDAEKKIAEQEKAFDTIAEYLAQQARPKDKRDKELMKVGWEKFSDNKIAGCAKCHTTSDGGGKSGPNLTGYGSQEWIREMLMNPHGPSRYGNKNQMPAFRNLEGPGAEVRKKDFDELNAINGATVDLIDLTDVERELIIRWMTGDDRVVFGGGVISGAQKKD